MKKLVPGHNGIEGIMEKLISLSGSELSTHTILWYILKSMTSAKKATLHWTNWAESKYLFFDGCLQVYWHNRRKGHLYKLGTTTEERCRMCGNIAETGIHILCKCECEALAKI